MTVTDVSAFIGDYPYRCIEPATPPWLLSQMDRLGIEYAWVGHLPSFLHRDPEPGNARLLEAVSAYRHRLNPIPVVNPRLPNWEDELNQAVEVGAAAVRTLSLIHI